ncbi:MAG: hypothetical protein U0Q22_04480 [Acidimicrobiales bacterium]
MARRVPINGRTSFNVKPIQRLAGVDLLGGSSSALTAVAVLRENQNAQDEFLSLNGTDTGGPRVALHAPWNSRVWYWDAGDTNSIRSLSPATPSGHRTSA